MTANMSGSGSGMRSRSNVRPRQGVASNELREARRRKRHREVIRNRIIFATVLAVLLALIIFILVKVIGLILGSGKIPEASTLTFMDNGKVVFEEVTDFDTDTYSKAELKKYTKDLVDSFNDAYGQKAITLDKLSVKGDKAYIKTEYKDAECYSAFTSYEVYDASYSDALEVGYDFEELFSTVTEQGLTKPQEVDAASLFAGSMVAIVRENVTVKVPGKVTYVSNADVELTDENTVTISQADGNLDATDLVYIIYTKQ